MENSIDVDEYLTTMVNTQHAETIPDKSLAAHHLQQLVQHTRHIGRYPYQPKHWLSRADTLLALDYTELASGDLWKAELCIDNIKQGQIIHPGSTLGHQCGFRVLDEPLDNGTSTVQAEELPRLWQSIVDLRSRINSENETTAQYTPRPYPWLSSQHRERGAEVLDDIRTSLRTTQPLSSDEQPFCEIRSQAHSETGTGGHEALGLFASTAIDIGTVIIRDNSDLYGVLSKKTEDWMYGRHNLLHMSKLRVEAVQQALVLIKCLLTAVDEKKTHPLELPAVARLKPSYHDKGKQKLNLANTIVAPNIALVNAGVDVLADVRYDTWVLFTIDARLANNIWSQPNSCGLAPLFAMLNHSCAPNCRWQVVHGEHLRTEVSTSRRIEPGEQLYVAYNEYVLDEAVQHRRQAMSHWIEGGCRCVRCEEELKLGTCNFGRDNGWVSSIVLDQTVSW